MEKVSNVEATLMGLLAEKPRYPYEVEQEVKYRDLRFWTELSMSSIYKVLRKLEQKGYVGKKNQISDNNRLRKIYTLTEAGETALKNKVLYLLSSHEHKKWRVDIGTYNCGILEKEEILAALEQYGLEIEEKIRGYLELEKFMKSIDCPDYRLSIALRPVYLLKGELEWIDSFKEQIQDE